MTETTLRERCKINTNKDSDTFVGVKCDNGNITVNFPLGFRLAADEGPLREDLLLLMNVLSKNTDKKESELNDNMDYQDVQLPIQAYLFLIADYYARGYYKEHEDVYEISNRGKINWRRTVKSQKPFIQGDDIYYLSFVTKKRNVNDNELITLIHEFCVYESFSKVGWIFTSYKPPKPKIIFNPKVFTGVVKKKMEKTFNDRNRQLFINMLAIIMSLGDNGPSTNFKYGTNRFEYIWESMINKVYGIKEKSNFFPKTRWFIEGKMHDNASLEPDTIMIVNGEVYVLDAKYYKCGLSNKPEHLPGSTSINKQITYGEYIAETEKFKDDHGKNPTVYNAFLMPYDSYGDKFYTGEKLHYIGSAISDWKSSNGTKPYEQVVGILLDVKSLMQSDSHDEDMIIELATLIK